MVFEFDTVRFDFELYTWEWNRNKNLVGKDKKSGLHKFTWQPHGSQFTIVEEVPDDSLIIKIKRPPLMDKKEVLKTLGVDDS